MISDLINEVKKIKSQVARIIAKSILDFLNECRALKISFALSLKPL